MSTALRFVGVSFAIATAAITAASSASAQTILYDIPGHDAGAGPRLSIATLEIKGAGAIAIGTPDHDEPGLPAAGKLEVYDVLTATLLYTVTGSGAGDRYGVRVSKGDVNGDGVAELIVGADQGGVGGYVDVLNASDGSLIEHVVESSPGAAIGGGGVWVSSGDVDGDGLRELAVGSPLEDSPVLPKTGAVHVISSSTGADIATIYGASSGAQFGCCSGGVRVGGGDVNGDGSDDLKIGAPGDGGTGSMSCYSGADFHLIWQTFGTVVGEAFGTAVAEIDHDFDGDGIPDLATGVVWAGLPPCPPGHVTLLSGASGSVISDLSGTEAGDQFGASIDFGDLDGDGVPAELLVGAPAASGGGVGRGRVAAFQWDTSLFPPAFVQIAEFTGQNDGDSVGLPVITIPPAGGGTVQVPTSAVAAPGYDDVGLLDVGQVSVLSIFDCVASATNYGAGWPGTLGIPAILANDPPSFGDDVTIHIDNSAPTATTGLLLVGFAQASIPTNAGGTILVALPWIVITLPLPVGGLDVSGAIPIDLRLCGFEVDLQCIELDAGASRNLSFTPGLSLVLGG